MAFPPNSLFIFPHNTDCQLKIDTGTGALFVVTRFHKPPGLILSRDHGQRYLILSILFR